MIRDSTTATGGRLIFERSVLRSFSNIGHLEGGRRFEGFPAQTAPTPLPLPPRGVLRVDLQAKDLLRIDGTHHADQLGLLAFSETGERCEARLGLEASATFDTTSFDGGPLHGWYEAMGGGDVDLAKGVRLGAMDEPVVFTVTWPITVWLVNMASSQALITGENAGPAMVWHQRASASPVLPPPLGHVREEFTIPRGTALAYRLAKGETVQIIDVEGQQCSDFQAFTAQGLDAGLERMIDSTATRTMVRQAFPRPGLLDKFFDPDMRPLMRVVQDTCGRHDTFGLACTARGYEERGFPGHVNCSDNISGALAPFGVRARNAWPAINFFWNTWMDDHHHILTEEAYSRPGDYVAMEALDDLVCVSTACPDDIDPINGWNPTDVHVRIYSSETRLSRAVAYRTKEDAPMQISQTSAFHDRLAPLTNHFAPARDLWAPVSFPSHGTVGEYWACRNAATLQDMSGLRKFDIIGPDAERLLQHAMTRNVAKLAVWRGMYTLMCDQSGEVIDDGTLFRLAPHLFRWCCGSEESGRWLSQLAGEMGCQVRIHDQGGALPNLALQGPKSRDILRKVAFFQPHVPTLDQMKWFGVSIARVQDREGAPFMVSRSGYTGELGYEIFCATSDALTIWDALMQAGAAEGLTPMGSAALDIIRIEAGLAGAQEFAPGADAFEAGLGFAVDLKKADFVGKAALERNATAPRKVLRGLVFECDDVPMHGAGVYAGERQVGVITSATRSPMFECSIAMARIAVEQAGLDTKLQVGQMDGRMKRLTARVTTTPFFDPKRARARA